MLMLKGQSVKYEWNVRVGESEDDFETLATFEKFQDAMKCSKQELGSHIELVRSLGSDYEGLLEQEWAVVKNKNLPEFFNDSYGTEMSKIPQRFHLEIQATK